jgi:FkbM family methyltransferase
MNLRGFIKYTLFRDTTQHGEFRALCRLARRDYPRIFVDVGANDGFYGSNSFPFVARGWRGILIEPHPGAFAKLQKRHRGRNGVTLLKLACSSVPGEQPLWIGTDGNEGTLATLCNEDDPRYQKTRTDQSVRVRVERLDALLTAHQVPREFGILSIDAERMDYEVLLGLDLNIWRPSVIIIEDFAPKDALRNEYMRRHGYLHRAQCQVNSLWISEER